MPAAGRSTGPRFSDQTVSATARAPKASSPRPVTQGNAPLETVTSSSRAASTGAGSPRGTPCSDSPQRAQNSHLGLLRVPHVGHTRKSDFMLDLDYTREAAEGKGFRRRAEALLASRRASPIPNGRPTSRA